MASDIDELEKKIRAAKGGEELSPEEARKQRDHNNAHIAAKAGFEFAAAIFLSAALGYFIDQQFETAPLFMIMFFFLGVGAGFVSLFRMSKNMGSAVGYATLHKEQAKAMVKDTEKDADNGLHRD